MKTSPPASALRQTALSRGADTSLTEQLAARFADPIRQRLLSAGARLPSVRECARKHGVSASTVVAAYDQLLAQGLVEVRKQRGFYVRETRSVNPVQARQRDAVPAVLLPPPLSATALVRGMFQPPGSLPMPGLGSLPVDWLDAPMLGAALKRVTAGPQLGALSLQYGEPNGDLRLRRALSTQLHDIGVAAAPEHIITTLGAIHALDVVTRSLLRSGDCVLVDEPGWPVEYARLAAMGLRVLPVPRGEAGPDLTVMQRHIDAHKVNPPRLYITVSVLHNPTARRCRWRLRTACWSWPSATTCTLLKMTPTPFWPRHTCRVWPHSTRWNAPSTSQVSRKFWPRIGVWVSSLRRLI